MKRSLATKIANIVYHLEELEGFEDELLNLIESCDYNLDLELIDSLKDVISQQSQKYYNLLNSIGCSKEEEIEKELESKWQ